MKNIILIALMLVSFTIQAQIQASSCGAYMKASTFEALLVDGDSKSSDAGAYLYFNYGDNNDILVTFEDVGQCPIIYENMDGEPLARVNTSEYSGEYKDTDIFTGNYIVTVEGRKNKFIMTLMEDKLLMQPFIPNKEFMFLVFNTD